jgi:uncharacterized protein (TIGR03086 family)
VSSPVDLHPAAERLARLVEAVPEDALDWPTPCEAYTVAALLDHVGGSVAAFRAAAIKQPLPGGPSGDAANLDPQWQSRLPGDARALAVAWDDPEAWTGMTAAGGVDLPGNVAAIVALDELVIHGWDLAKAIDQPAGYDGPGVDEVLQMTTQFRGGGAEGLFGPEVAVPPDAPTFDRILGVTGRDPNWTSPRSPA